MEAAPAMFAGTVFALFGAGLLAWTAARVSRRVPVTESGGRIATASAVAFGVVSLLVGVWTFLRI